MSALLGRRRLIRLALGFTGALAGSGFVAALPAAAAPPARRETSHWRFMGTTRCNAGQVEEWWCYYECVGASCTPVQYEWRSTGRAC